MHYFEVNIFQPKYQFEYQITYAVFKKYDRCDDDENVMITAITIIY